MPSEMQHIRRLATTSQKLLHSVEVRGCFSSYSAATKMSKFGRQTEKPKSTVDGPPSLVMVLSPPPPRHPPHPPTSV